MANQITLVQKMLPLLDEVYKSAAKSAGLEAPAEFIRETADAHSVKIAKLALQGLGNYDKAKGFPEGDVNLTWETHEFANDRGRRFTIDRMDNQESFNLVAGRLVGNFMREYVIPEVDAYRFAKIATKAGTKVEATLNDSTTKAALDTAIVALQEKEVDDGNMVIYMTPTIAQALSDNIARTTLNGEGNVRNIIETYNGIQIVRVPQTRFYTQITLDAGAQTTQGGYKKTPGSGEDINFIVMDRGACYNVTKLNVARLFTPDVNQSKDAYQFDFRLYHDTFVLDNKTAGIYVHHKAAA